MTAEKQSALQTIEEKRDLITGIADKIWEFAELSLQEFKSAAAYCEALEKEGYQCRVDLVLAVDMKSDKPGTLDHILSDLQNANVMIRYLYISFDRQTSSPIAVFSTTESETEAFLKGKGYHLLDRF